MTDRETLDVYNAQAQQYRDRFGADTKPDVQLRHFLDHLPENADLLDLGCGPGRTAAIMARAGHRVTATDASTEMIRLASEHEGITTRQESFDDLAGVRIYDGIWANFSLLHAAPDVLPRHLRAISDALKPGGCFHIGMKTGEGMRRDGLGRRYTFVTEPGLADMLRSVGLTPFKTWSGRGVGLAGTEDPWVVIQARKDG